ncbi:MAG: respiratory chain complex I subunit 1 family protein [Candidatus Dormibacteria bacterium]
MPWLTSLAQLLGGAILAPLLPGLIQAIKARLQGRRGPSVLQPYRELRRLWGKTAVAPEGISVLYRLAPAVVAAAMGCALLVLAPVGAGDAAPLGHDFLVLIGLLALARFAIATSAWDTSNGFGLIGAARDLTLAASAEAAMLLALAVAALPARSTDLLAIGQATAGTAVWLTPAHWCAVLAFAVVALAETGRQPVDNPDTHLELTMIHEGPLLEYAGRDLAYLQWAAAARHWIVLSLMVAVLLPHGAGAGFNALVLTGWLLVIAAALALTETLLAKMRLVRVPVFLGTGALIAVIGLTAGLLGPR